MKPVHFQLGVGGKGGLEVVNDVDRKSDIITIEAKKLGLWIVGASNYWLVPDAAVIPDWEIHKRYIDARENKNYDGGATSNDYTQVLSHREWIEKKAKDCSVPIFHTVGEAAEYLKSEYLKASQVSSIGASL